jgi:magnesium chelatase family protein
MRPGETSAEVRVRVEAARQHQRNRFAGANIASNADMHPAQIRKYCALDDACQALMKTAMRQLQLTARAYHRVLKLSRTIADLAGSEAITQVHLAEALQHRPELDLMCVDYLNEDEICQPQICSFLTEILTLFEG